MSTPSAELWLTGDKGRFFLIPTKRELSPGSLPISTLDGTVRRVVPGELAPYEVTEHQARSWASGRLGQTLDELKAGLDQKLADLRRQLEEKDRTPVTEESTVTPNAATAVFDLLKKLPGVIGNSLSGDEKRVESAKTTMADLQRELKEAGIDLDQRFTDFPDRLAELRKGFPQKPE